MKFKATNSLIVLALSLALLPAVAEAGTCLGGARSGLPCSSSFDCGTCNAGPFAGFACISSGSCGRYCSAGVRRGFSCSSSLDCQGNSCVAASCVGYCSSFFSAASENGVGEACPPEQGTVAAIFQQDPKASAAAVSQP